MYSRLPISRQVFSHFQESSASSRLTVAWEDEWHHATCIRCLPLSPAFTDGRSTVWWGIGPWSGWFSSPGCVPCKHLVLPRSRREVGAAWEAKRPRHCISAVQQQVKHRCVLNTALVTSLKDITLQPTVKKICCASAKTK